MNRSGRRKRPVRTGSRGALCLLSVSLSLCLLLCSVSGCSLIKYFPSEESASSEPSEESSAPAESENPGEASIFPESGESAPEEEPVEEASGTVSPVDGTPPEEPQEKPPVKPEKPLRDPLPERVLRGMTLREKVGQLFVVAPEDLDRGYSGDSVGSYTEAMEQSLKEYPVGGLILFGRNVWYPDQLSSFLEELHGAGKIPLFLSVDEEGGLVARLANNDSFGLPRYGSAGAVGSSGDPADALQMGRTIGGYLKKYGFNMDFAPVADVNTNPYNPVIGNRAFSSDPQVAAEMASAMAQGLRENGIIPVFKHFPGHGDTREDSHEGMTSAYKTKEEMLSCEWIPFLRAGDSDGIMVGHITTPNLTDDGLPASLSSLTVTGVLREELGFSGLIITDSLEMGAITQLYGAADAAVMAFEAGCDLLLLPKDLPAAFDAVYLAVSSGEIGEERLNESVRRILRLKDRYGFLPKPEDPAFGPIPVPDPK